MISPSHLSVILASYRFLGASAKEKFVVEHPECRLFLAESTIPNAGLGIFTGIPLQPNQSIAEPDLIVPITDIEWNTGNDLDFHFLWTDYSWQLGEVGMETDAYTGSALVIGTGCMPNCNYALINAYEGKPTYNHAGLHRSTDPGTSGFTGFYNQKMITLDSIPAGGEIFVAYGEHWFYTRPEAMGTVPLPHNFEVVDSFLRRFKRIKGKYQRSHNPDFTKDLWDAISFVHLYETRDTNALPRKYEDLMNALVVGSGKSFLPYSVKTLGWLSEHGRCMDNIRPENSTIKQAGRGAFASRFIPKGGLVAPGPLLHIPNKTALNIYKMNPHTGERDLSKLDGKQLILNYCFGHHKSTLLLCPYTSPSAYINHSSKAPNVKLVWAKEGTPNFQHDWLIEDINFLKSQEAIGLSVDFVATTDIQPGEEVFIDYGSEWEIAWNTYLKEWKAPEGSENYIAGAQLQSDLSIPLKTLKEQESDPYSDNVIFFCHYDYDEDSGGNWKWDDSWSNIPLYPCNIISRQTVQDKNGNVQYYYDAIMLTMSEAIQSKVVIDSYGTIPDGEQHVMTQIPRWAIQARDKMYTKDEYMPNSFRHEMMMPDDIFPVSWMNL